MTTLHTRHERLRRHLDRMAEALIRTALLADPRIQEGTVLTVGPPAYRRLDCAGRALAYVRSRPRRAAVRVDLSGLWRIPKPSPLQIPSATGAALLVGAYDEVDLAVAFLLDAIRRSQPSPREAA